VITGDALTRLQHENPVPETMPTLAMEIVLRRIDDESSTEAPHPTAPRHRERRVSAAASVTLSIAVALVVVGVAILAGGTGNHSARPGAPTHHHLAAVHRHGYRDPAGDTGRSVGSRPRVTLAEVSRDVRCVACHQRLDRARAIQAVFERKYIRFLIMHGDSKRQIEKRLVAQYGPNVLVHRNAPPAPHHPAHPPPKSPSA
jgi:hypothetical protein